MPIASVRSPSPLAAPSPPPLASLAFRALGMLAVLTVLTGVCYPLAVTAAANVLFHDRAVGSPVVENGTVRGSSLLGQPFESPRYFWGRPSATGAKAYDAEASAGSNLGPTNDALTKAAASRIDRLREADPENLAPVPVDLVTASASGLDPHVTPAAAEYQVRRVARTRGLPVERVRALVAAHTEERSFGVLGEPRVNVLELNLALDREH